MGLSSIPHVYDDKELKYEEVVEILTKAANGRIQGTEKTDGLNLFLGYKDGQPKAARNFTEISQGGLDAEAFADREFKADDHIKEIFRAAFNAFSNVVKHLNQEQINILFGTNGNTFLNCEIISGKTNVITYDTQVILIHRSGHKEFNTATGKVESVRADRQKAISIMISNFNEVMQQMLNGTEFKVQQDRLERLPALEDQSTLANTIQKLKQAGFKEGMTINDYLLRKSLAYVKEKLPSLNNEITIEVAKKIVGAKGADSITVLKSYVNQNPKFVEELQSLVKRKEEIVDEITFPIEDAIHDFTVEILSKLNSQFVQDKEKSTEVIKQELAKKVKEIQNYNGPDREKVHNKLKKQLLKLKHIDKISSPTEGFVFNYNSKMYKFTGNFAPVNQIRNMKINQETDTSGASSMNFNLKENKSKIGIFPGSFRPPHKGHLDLIKKALPNYSKIIVLVSQPEKNMRSDISAEQSKQIFDEYTRGLPVETRTCGKSSPYVEAADMIKSGEGNIVLTSDKEPTKFDKFNFPKEVIHAEHNISASQMRNIIGSEKTREEKKAELLGYLPEKIDSEIIFNVLLNQEQPISLQEIFSMIENLPIKENNSSNTLKMEDIFSILDEMSGGGAVGSSMSAGAVEGASMLTSKPQRKKKKTRTYTLEEIINMSNNYLKESKND
jgi:cytidyltransferase-like protein